MSSNESNKRYLVLKKFFSDSPRIVESDKVIDVIENDKEGSDREWYASVYYYNEEQAKLIKEKNSTAGVRDVRTDKLVFDFDCESNPDNARKDAVTLCNRLKQRGIGEDSIEIYYSGNKGFHVIVPLTHSLTPKQTQIAAGKLAVDLSTFDKSVYDAPQILRVPWTKNKTTNLYKVPVTFKDLNSKTMVDIKKVANDTSKVEADYSNVKHVELSQELTKEDPQPTKTYEIVERPKHWSELKWNLLNAVNLKPEERHHALMVIAATCRGIGYPEDMARALCLTFDEKFTQSTGKPPVEDLESNVLRTIYSTGWNGGQYSVKNDLFLQEYAKRINIDVSSQLLEEDPVVNINETYSIFKDFATNIDKLTVKTGIAQLDAKCRMTIGMTVGIVAAPSVGKTSLALQILNSMSNSNEKSIFFSYDMYSALVFQKLVQKHLNVTDKEIYAKFKDGDDAFQEQVIDVLKTEYQNVDFCFKTGQTPDQIEKTILFSKQKNGVLPRLIVIDYSELVLSEMSDSTASSAFVAQKLREIATKYNICVVVLLQPNKAAGTPADEIMSYRSAKGSSSIEQALSIMIGMSRPGYDPKKPENDKFITINCLKNRMGSLFSLDLGWEGLTGDIYELNHEGKAMLEHIREEKRQEANKSEEW